MAFRERPDLVEDLGELMLAYRTYTGLSQRVFADLCGIKEASLSDIEVGRRPCPLPIRERAEAVVERFDNDVDQVVAKAEEMLTGNDTDTVHLPVSRRKGDEWPRAVIGRAAVTSGLIVPLSSVDTSKREAG